MPEHAPWASPSWRRSSWLGIGLFGLPARVEAQSCGRITIEAGTVTPGDRDDRDDLPLLGHGVRPGRCDADLGSARVQRRVVRHDPVGDDLQGGRRLPPEPNPAGRVVVVRLPGTDRRHGLRATPRSARRWSSSPPHRRRRRADADAEGHAEADPSVDAEGHAEAARNTKAGPEVDARSPPGRPLDPVPGRRTARHRARRRRPDRRRDRRDRQPRPITRPHARPDGLADASGCRRRSRGWRLGRWLRHPDSMPEGSGRRDEPADGVARDHGRRPAAVPCARPPLARRRGDPRRAGVGDGRRRDRRPRVAHAGRGRR